MISTRANVSASAVFALAAAISLFSPTAALADTACISGHNTVAPPCTFDSGILLLSSATGFPSGGGGGGHHTLAEFVGPTVTIEADIAAGKLPFEATDNLTTGISELTGTVTISTVSGEPLIGDLSLQLLSPDIIGTGTMSFSLTGTGNVGPLTGLSGSTFQDVSFAPTNSITETIDFVLSTGCGAPSATCTGNAIIDGVTIGISTVPEPNSIALLSGALVAIGFLRRKLSRSDK